MANHSENEVDRDKTDGADKIVGIADHPQNKEAHPATAETRTYKVSPQ